MIAAKKDSSLSLPRHARGSLLRLMSSWPPVRCWWVASRSLCSISAGSAGSDAVPQNHVLNSKYRFLRFHVIWKVKTSYGFCFFFEHICHFRNNNRYLRFKTPLNSVHRPPIRPGLAEPVYINSRSTAKRLLHVTWYSMKKAKLLVCTNPYIYMDSILLQLSFLLHFRTLIAFYLWCCKSQANWGNSSPVQL